MTSNLISQYNTRKKMSETHKIQDESRAREKQSETVLCRNATYFLLFCSGQKRSTYVVIYGISSNLE